tara:strand:- start:899 stop:1474 length:576 start_codon:yes stop_codon:yes gene_type:complete
LYWGKPITGFGDLHAEILVLGLAPAAHGGNRTGRVFTGDKSAEFLFKCLYLTKFSNQSTSENVNDGLILYNIYMSLVLKCVPPNDKPTSEELSNCFYFLEEEIKQLKKIKVVLTLGKIAFDSYIKLLNLPKKNFKFTHGNFYKIKEDLTLIACYHPSPRNVNTGRLNKEMMVNLLRKLRDTVINKKKPHPR